MLFACASLLLAGCGGGEQAFPTASETVTAPTVDDWRPLYDAWDEPDPIPSFPLIDQSGRAFHLGELSPHWVMVGFVFSRCPMPEACPLTMSKMASVQALWAEATAAGRTGDRSLRLLTLTLDPEHDTPEILAAYGEAYGADFDTWTLATGEPELLEVALPSLFSVLALPDPTVRIRHTVKVALLSPGLVFVTEWANNAFEAQDVVERVLRE